MSETSESLQIPGAFEGRPSRARLQQSWRPRGPLGWTAILAALILSAPILAVLLSLFSESEGAWRHLAESVLADYIANSLWLCLGVGGGVLIGGVSSAWLVTMCRFPLRKLFEWALILPLAVPAYVMAYAYTDFLAHHGPVQSLLRDVMGWGPREYWFPNIRSLEGAVLMFSLVLYPYVYLLSRAAFLEQSVCVLEVSRTLGQNAWGAFWRVALPLARPAIITGMALALMETLADFGTVAHFGVPTFTTGIYRAWFSMGDRIAAAQLASLLLAFVLVLLLIEQLQRGRARYHQTSSRYQKLPRIRLQGAKAALAIAVCALPLAFGFLLPMGILLEMALSQGGNPFEGRYLTLIFNSVTLSGITAAAAVAIALLLAYATRLNPNRATLTANRIAAMGYALPGSIIAVGILIPLASLDNALDAWSERVFGLDLGLLFTGSIFALVFAYLVRFMAISLKTVEASLGKVTPNMDDAARTLGSGGLLTLLRVHAPIMRGSLLTAGLIVFVDVMKELPATLIMRPFNFDTLAIQAYRFASDERLREAATPALMIVAAGLLPVLLLSRSIRHSRPGQAKLPRNLFAEAGKEKAPLESGAPL
ncbi:MAG: iron ABC transporter permease [Rhodovibrionaceae bacterium]